MGSKKNVENTVKWFLENFKDNEENVGLVLKLNCKNSSTIDGFETKRRVKNFIEEYGKESKCKVYIIHGDMSEEELHALYNHPKMSAMISFTHGEGYGLPLFEAAYNGLPVIAPDWSGHMDFLVGKDAKGRKKPLFLTVDFTIGNVTKEAIWKGVVDEQSKWCYPQEYSFKRRLNDFLKKKVHIKKEQNYLAKQIKENFSQEKIYEEFVNSMLLQPVDSEKEFEEIFVV